MPFTQEQFLNVFSDYNLSIWPVQVILNILAVFSVFLIFKRYPFSDRMINSILSFLWMWMGIVYHMIFFSEINPAAYIFGILFIIQGIVFLFSGVIRNTLQYEISNSYLPAAGIIFILFALFIYPFFGLFLDHTYPANPTFGLPCPTTIFTFGILLFSGNKIPVYIFIIPLFWSLLGFSAALNLGIYEDTGLLAAGLTGTFLIIFVLNKRKEVI